MSFLLLLISTLQWSWRKSTEQVLPEREGEGERVETGGRNDPNNVCTREKMNKKRKKFYRKLYE
jgi:hypothetical protein